MALTGYLPPATWRLVRRVVRRVVRATSFREAQVLSRRDRLMTPLGHVGVTTDELNDMVEGKVWERWLIAEPSLAVVGSLGDLHELRGLATDGPLGALVRLAARDGGDDQLAGIAVVHQLNGGVRRLIASLGDQSDDIEAIVIGALWERVRAFPWQRRRRAYAANLMLDTKTSVMAFLQPGRTRRGPEPVAFIESTTCLEALAQLPACRWPDNESCGAGGNDLADLLAWAQLRRVIPDADVALLLQLVEAGREVAELESPRTLRGVCSDAALRRVAQRRGVSTKTILRQRNRAVAALRAQAPLYLAEVA